MSKTASDELFQLVKALTKSEKRYFRLFVSRQNGSEHKKFVKLFDAIDKQKEYNEAQILLKERSIKPQQLSNLKAHLHKQILQSLKLCNSSQVIDMQIRELIDHAQLLYNKCLYKQCIKVLDKAKKMAMLNDRSILLLDILEMEKLLVGQTVEKNNLKRVNRIIHETETVANSIKNINIFSNLSIRLNSFYLKVGFIRSKREYERVKEFFDKSLPAFEEAKLSFHEKLYLYYSFVGYYFFIHDFKNGYMYAKKWVHLFDTSPEMIIPKLEMYIKGINSLLTSQSKLLKHKEFVETSERLKKIPAIPGIKLTENVQLVLFKYSYVHEINRHFMLGDFDGGISIVSSIENGLEKFTFKLDKHYVLIFYYKIACLYFGSGRYKEAVMWLNRIMNSKDVDVREDIHSFARILSLISHFELGNSDLVEYHVRSTYRFLLKKGNFNGYEKLILLFLKSISKEIITAKNLISSFRELKEQLLPLNKDPYENRAFIYFDIISWLESKINNKKVQDIIREKAKKKLDL